MASRRYTARKSRPEQACDPCEPHMGDGGHYLQSGYTVFWDLQLCRSQLPGLCYEMSLYHSPYEEIREKVK